MANSSGPRFMREPSTWELFQNVMIGTVAGVIASGITNMGYLGVATLALLFWFILVLGLKISMPIFEWAEEEEEETEYQPYKDVDYAS